MTIKIKLLFLILLLIGMSASDASASNHSWKITIAPYLWAMNMNGRVQSGTTTMHVSQSFSDIMSQFQGGGMLLIDAQKDDFGLFVNAIYAVLSEDVLTAPMTVTSHTRFGIFSGGISYTVFNKTFAHSTNRLAIDPYLGARYTLNNTTLKAASLSLSNNKHWTDPIIGARLRYLFQERWSVIAAGDVGGTNTNNHCSYNVQGFLGYHPKLIKNTTVYAGYRVLYQKYLTGSGANRFNWNMKLFGPVLGAAIEW